MSFTLDGNTYEDEFDQVASSMGLPRQEPEVKTEAAPKRVEVNGPVEYDKDREKNFFERLSIANAFQGMVNPSFDEDVAILKSAWEALKLPGDVAQGKERPDNIQRVFDLATTAVLAPVAKLTKAEATLGSGAIKPKPLFDYEQMGNGKFEVFDPKTGKTFATVNTADEAEKLVSGGFVEPNGLVPGTPEFDATYGYKPYYPDPKQYEKTSMSDTAKAMQEIEDILNALEGKPVTNPLFNPKANADSFYKGVAKETDKKMLEYNTPEYWAKVYDGLDAKPKSAKESFLAGIQQARKEFKNSVSEIQNRLKTLFQGPVGDQVKPPKIQGKGDYTEPAYRGMTVYGGKEANPVYDFGKSRQMYSTANPMLADMYAGYLTKHPGIKVPEGVFPGGAQVQPLLINTKDYLYFDAKGEIWQKANPKAMEQAQKAGKKGVIVDNVWDEPESTTALGRPNKIFITFPEGAGTVKSRFATEFNEKSPNLMHSIGIGGPLGYISMQEKDEQ